MDTSKLKNASKQQKMIGCGGCLAVLLVLFVIFWIIGTVTGPSEPEKEATATATTQAPVTEKAKPTKEAKPTEKPKPTEAPKPTKEAKPTEAPKPTNEAKPTAAPTKAAKKSKCESASPEVLETISGGLHDGRVLKEGWIVKSDINDLWYVSAPIPDSSLTGVWIITRPDGTGLTVSANSATAMYSNWPDGTKSPKFEPVSGEGLDIVQKALACQP